MANFGPATVDEAFFRQSRVDRLRKLAIADESCMCIEQIECAGVADRHQRQSLALGHGQDAHVECVKSGRIDSAQFARARAGRRFQLQEMEPQLHCNTVGGDVEFCASAAGRAAGIISKLHGAAAFPRNRRRAGAVAAVLTTRRVLSGLILPRSSSRKMRAKLASARSPCTRSTSAPGSTRPRAAMIARNACEWRAIPGINSAVLAFSGSITRLTIGMAAGQASSHL